MDWLFLATGVTGAWTFVWFLRIVGSLIRVKPEVQARMGTPGSLTEMVVQEILQARREVLVLTPFFAARPIAQALIEARLKHRVVIDVLVSPGAERAGGSDLPFLVDQGLRPVVETGTPSVQGALILIDRRTVLAGTWSMGTTEVAGDQSLFVIKGYPDIARMILETYNAHKAHVRPVAIPKSPVTEVLLGSVPPPASPKPAVLAPATRTPEIIVPPTPAAVPATATEPGLPVAEPTPSPPAPSEPLKVDDHADQHQEHEEFIPLRTAEILASLRGKMAEASTPEKVA